MAEAVEVKCRGKTNRHTNVHRDGGGEPIPPFPPPNRKKRDHQHSGEIGFGEKDFLRGMSKR